MFNNRLNMQKIKVLGVNEAIIIEI